jgi:hypothetical protein
MSLESLRLGGLVVAIFRCLDYGSSVFGNFCLFARPALVQS